MSNEKKPYSHARTVRKKQYNGLKQQIASQLIGDKSIHEIKCFVKEHDKITRSLVKTGPEFLHNADIFGLPILITGFPLCGKQKHTPTAQTQMDPHCSCFSLQFLRG